MVLDHLDEYRSVYAACQAIGPKVGVGVESLRQSVPIFDTDIAFSYLPGCHVAERISGIYNRLYNGTPAYFVNDLSRLYEYMLEVRPTGLHQRVPVFLGSKAEVEVATRQHLDHDRSSGAGA